MLRQTLERMTRLVVPPRIWWELLVVNNNSTDDTDRVVALFERRLPLRLVFEPVPGLSHARNTALRLAAGSYILWTDDDVLVAEGWLAAFVEAVRAHPSAAAYGGPIDPLFVEKPDPVLLDAFPVLAMGFCGLDETVYKEHGAIVGANMGLNRSALGDLEFDCSLGRAPGSVRGGEECDLIRRVRGAGGTTEWCPDMRVTHVVPPDRMTVQYLSDYARNTGEEHIQTNGIPTGTTLWGVPRWLIRRCLEEGAMAIANRLSGRRRDGLTWRRKCYETAGMLRACRAMALAARVDHVATPADAPSPKAMASIRSASKSQR